VREGRGGKGRGREGGEKGRERGKGKGRGRERQREGVCTTGNRHPSDEILARPLVRKQMQKYKYNKRNLTNTYSSSHSQKY